MEHGSDPARGVPLRSTFLHVKGVGAKRELALWRRGVTTWDAALAGDLSWLGKRAGAVRKASAISTDRLERRDAAFFSRRLPGHQRLRLYDTFQDEAAFLDIETDPLRITMIGVSFQGRYRAFIAGRDLEAFQRFMDPVKVVVTYNGSGFDLPIILDAFYPPPRMCPHRDDDIFSPPRGVHLPGMGHIDLLSVLHRLGITGGLKASEEQLGITRPAEVSGLDGLAAVMLWRRHRGGDRKALDLLVEYNRQDVVNLKRIVELLEAPGHGSGRLTAPREA